MNKIKLLLLLCIFCSLFTNAQIPNNISPSDKVYGLSKFWQEVNYNFVYLDKVDRALWENRYKELISIVQNTENDYEYYRELQKFCALLKDGHTNIYFPDYIEDYISINEFGDYQIFISNIEDKAIITRVNLSKKDEIPLGTEIIEVNGLDTKDYINKNVIPYISSSTAHVLRDWGAKHLLEAPYGTTFELKMRLPNNKIKILNITCAKSSERKYFPPFVEQQPLDFKWLKNGIAYVAINTFDNDKVKDLFIEKVPELKKARSLIIDIRNNGGGNSSNALNIVDFITNDTIIKLSKSSTRQNLSAYKAWGENLTTNNDSKNNSSWETLSYLAFNDKLMYDIPHNNHLVKKDVDKIIIPTVVLIGHNTASSAEDFLIYLHNQKHITTIGEPTFGSTGMPMTFELPHEGEARICTKKDTYPNGDEFVGIGIIPDIKAQRTLNDYLKSNDKALKEAIKYLKLNMQ